MDFRKKCQKNPVLSPLRRSLLLKRLLARCFHLFWPKYWPKSRPFFVKKCTFWDFFLKQYCLNTLFYTLFLYFNVFFTTLIKGISSKFAFPPKIGNLKNIQKYSKSREIRNPLAEKTITCILNLACKYRILIVFWWIFQNSTAERHPIFKKVKNRNPLFQLELGGMNPDFFWGELFFFSIF